MYGSALKFYLQMLDPLYHQGLRLHLGAFRMSPVDREYIDAHEPRLGARCVMLPKHPIHHAVSDNKYMRPFDARLKVILHIKLFLTASN